MPSEPVQLASGSWRCQVSTGVKNEKGRYIYDSVTADTAREVRRLALNLEDEYRQKRRDPTSITLDAAILKYENARSNILSPSTIRGYEIIRKNRFASLMDMKISKINKQVLQNAVNEESKTCSPKTVANAYGLVRSVIGSYTGVSFTGIRLPQIPDNEKEFLDTAQIMKFIEFCEGDSCEIPMLMAVWLGIRRSEILGIRWESIDFENKKIRIENAVVPDKNNKFVSNNRTKTKKSRRVLRCPGYILQKLLVYRNAELKKLKAENPEAELSGLIFHINPETLRKHVKKTCARAGITEVGVHGLRHTNASVMLTLGIADKIAMQRGGWSNEKTMKEIYQHIFQDDKAAADDAIDKYFNALTKEQLSHELSHDISK